MVAARPGCAPASGVIRTRKRRRASTDRAPGALVEPFVEQAASFPSPREIRTAEVETHSTSSTRSNCPWSISRLQRRVRVSEDVGRATHVDQRSWPVPIDHLAADHSHPADPGETDGCIHEALHRIGIESSVVREQDEIRFGGRRLVHRRTEGGGPSGRRGEGDHAPLPQRLLEDGPRVVTRPVIDAEHRHARIALRGERRDGSAEPSGCVTRHEDHENGGRALGWRLGIGPCGALSSGGEPSTALSTQSGRGATAPFEIEPERDQRLRAVDFFWAAVFFRPPSLRPRSSSVPSSSSVRRSFLPCAALLPGRLARGGLLPGRRLAGRGLPCRRLLRAALLPCRRLLARGGLRAAVFLAAVFLRAASWLACEWRSSWLLPLPPPFLGSGWFVEPWWPCQDAMRFRRLRSRSLMPPQTPCSSRRRA